ncbi:MAG: type domain [Pseudomonadota bacterium]|jgi:hypothetical protein
MTATQVEATPDLSLDALVHAYVEGARRRERPARHLAQRRDWVAALRLYLEAAVLLMRANLAVTGERGSLEELPPCELLDELLQLSARERWLAPPELARLRPLLSAVEWDALDGLQEAQAEHASDELETALRFLASQIPAVRHAERRRELRKFAAGAVLLSLTILGVLFWSLTRPRNLALKRPVSATPAGFQTEAAEAVNGARFGELGFHSANASAWLQVDLEAERSIHRVAIYGRGDCCFEQSIPLLVEGSLDGASYFGLGRFDQPFQPFRPSVLALQATNIRYLRLRPQRSNFLVVTEVEVY